MPGNVDDSSSSQRSPLLPTADADDDDRIGGADGGASSAPPPRDPSLGFRHQYADQHHGYQETARRKPRKGFAIPRAEEDLHHARKRWDDDSWQMKTMKFLTSRPVEIALVVLLLMDVLVLFIELAIDTYFPSCHIIVRDAVSCCPAPEDESYALLGGGESHEQLCQSPLEDTTHTAGCDEHKHHTVHVVHDALFWCTIAILITFEIELLLTIYLLGPSNFCHHFCYALDFFVISVSLFLELLFRGAANAGEVIPGILVLFRVWRFVRIGHGLVYSTYEVEEHKKHVAVEHIAVLERRLRACGDDVPERPEQLKEDEDEE